MTEIENILNGFPYDFLVREPDKSYKDLKLIIELKVDLHDGTVYKTSLLRKKDEFFLCTWVFNFVENREVFVEFVPLTREEALQYCDNKISKINTAKDAIRQS